MRLPVINGCAHTHTHTNPNTEYSENYKSTTRLESLRIYIVIVVVAVSQPPVQASATMRRPGCRCYTCITVIAVVVVVVVVVCAAAEIRSHDSLIQSREPIHTNFNSHRPTGRFSFDVDSSHIVEISCAQSHLCRRRQMVAERHNFGEYFAHTCTCARSSDSFSPSKHERKHTSEHT